MRGQTAFLSAHWGGDFVIADVADPAHPAVFAAMDMPGHVWQIAVAGAHAYLADWDGYLHIVDVARPAVPALVGRLSFAGEGYGVALAGDVAYVAAGVAGCWWWTWPIRRIRTPSPSTKPPVTSTTWR
ncbi:MAG: hypothetical protein R2873_04395 [Caldilineaceae bacterium]